MLSVALGTARAQVSIGILSFGSYSGGPFDAVNNANLNVHFQIPVLAKPGPLPFSYAIGYDSSVWYDGGGGKWTPVPYWGWAGISPAAYGYIGYTAFGPATCYDSQHQPHTFYAFSSWVYYDQWGVGHNFSFTIYTQTPCGPTPAQETVTATDSSGYTLTAYAGSTSATTTLYSRSGALINVPAVTSGTGSGGSVTDSNGNTISATSSGGTDYYYDTLLPTGTAALTISGAAPNPTAFTYPAPARSAETPR